ncbi:perilipin-3-like isoform X4 [Lithobates pipiens]
MASNGTDTADHTEQSVEQQNLVERVANIPLVSSAYSMVSEAYTSTKDSHPYIRSVCDVAEMGAKTLTGAAVTGSKPIISRLEPQIATANELACKGLDKLESSLPILQQPADKVASDAKSLVTGARDVVVGAVTSTVTGARDTVTSAVSGAVSGVVGLATGAIQGSISATRSAVSTVMESQVGQFVTSSVDSVLGKTEEWVDHYLPMTDEELSQLASTVEGFEVAPLQQQKEQQSYYVRLGSLSSRIRHRAYQHSLGKALDSRVLSMTQMMTKQLQTTCFTLISGAQGLPANIQERMQHLRQNVQELHTSFASVHTLGDLSGGILSQSRTKATQVHDQVNELFSYVMANIPLTWVVGPFAPQIVERPETPEDLKE